MDGTYQGACSVFEDGRRRSEVPCCSLVKGPGTRSAPRSCPPEGAASLGAERAMAGGIIVSPQDKPGGSRCEPTRVLSLKVLSVVGIWS